MYQIEYDETARVWHAKKGRIEFTADTIEDLQRKMDNIQERHKRVELMEEAKMDEMIVELKDGMLFRKAEDTLIHLKVGDEFLTITEFGVCDDHVELRSKYITSLDDVDFLPVDLLKVYQKHHADPADYTDADRKLEAEINEDFEFIWKHSRTSLMYFIAWGLRECL